MHLSYGRDLFMTPGPSVIPDRVLNAMHRAAPNIYAGPLVDSFDDILKNLRKIARTSGNVSVYVCNGHGVWEAALHNVIAPGQKVLTLATGRFGHGWAEVAQKMGIAVELLDFGSTSRFDPETITQALRADKFHEIKAVMGTHTDTSTSVSNDIAALRAAIDAADHPALLMVDCIASLGCERFEMDAWGVDVMVAGCQKGLMTPPGLAFTFHNAKADAVSQSITKTSPYWDWAPRISGARFYQKFGGTPPTHHLFGLEAALEMLVVDEGLENLWARHKQQAEAIWAAIDAWAIGGVLRCSVPDPNHRSYAVTTIISDDADFTALRHWCENQAGLVLGIGLGFDNRAFRIGHMGHMNPPMLLGALATIDAGLKACNIPHGKGAIDAAVQVISR